MPGTRRSVGRPKAARERESSREDVEEEASESKSQITRSRDQENPPIVGKLIDSQDSDGRWWKGEVVGVSEESLKIHFPGFNSRHDRWVPFSRIAPLDSATGPQKGQTQQRKLPASSSGGKAVRSAARLNSLIDQSTLSYTISASNDQNVSVPLPSKVVECNSCEYDYSYQEVGLTANQPTEKWICSYCIKTGKQQRKGKKRVKEQKKSSSHPANNHVSPPKRTPSKRRASEITSPGKSTIIESVARAGRKRKLSDVGADSQASNPAHPFSNRLDRQRSRDKITGSVEAESTGLSTVSLGRPTEQGNVETPGDKPSEEMPLGDAVESIPNEGVGTVSEPEGEESVVPEPEALDTEKPLKVKRKRRKALPDGQRRSSRGNSGAVDLVSLADTRKPPAARSSLPLATPVNEALQTFDNSILDIESISKGTSEIAALLPLEENDASNHLSALENRKTSSTMKKKNDTQSVPNAVTPVQVAAKYNKVPPSVAEEIEASQLIDSQEEVRRLSAEEVQTAQSSRKVIAFEDSRSEEEERGIPSEVSTDAHLFQSAGVENEPSQSAGEAVVSLLNINENSEEQQHISVAFHTLSKTDGELQSDEETSRAADVDPEHGDTEQTEGADGKQTPQVAIRRRKGKRRRVFSSNKIVRRLIEIKKSKLAKISSGATSRKASSKKPVDQTVVKEATMAEPSAAMTIEVMKEEEESTVVTEENPAPPTKTQSHGPSTDLSEPAESASAARKKSKRHKKKGSFTIRKRRGRPSAAQRAINEGTSAVEDERAVLPEEPGTNYDRPPVPTSPIDSSIDTIKEDKIEIEPRPLADYIADPPALGTVSNGSSGQQPRPRMKRITIIYCDGCDSPLDVNVYGDGTTGNVFCPPCTRIKVKFDELYHLVAAKRTSVACDRCKAVYALSAIGLETFPAFNWTCDTCARAGPAGRPLQSKNNHASAGLARPSEIGYSSKMPRRDVESVEQENGDHVAGKKRRRSTKQGRERGRKRSSRVSLADLSGASINQATVQGRDFINFSDGVLGQKWRELYAGVPGNRVLSPPASPPSASPIEGPPAKTTLLLSIEGAEHEIPYPDETEMAERTANWEGARRTWDLTGTVYEKPCSESLLSAVAVWKKQQSA